MQGEIDRFNIGYVIACANLVNLHDEPGLAADVMAELGVSWADINRMRLTGYDMKALRKIKDERRGEAFADGRKRRRATTAALAQRNRGEDGR